MISEARVLKFIKNFIAIKKKKVVEIYVIDLVVNKIIMTELKSKFKLTQ